ncbi:protein KNATM [Carica papaya]|uniref:protein KNATM n=1 Tax=Carica papaya TaxID=3649 RepID=UPI000B8CAAD5|nr:protein KNATM [Carica papaya]
MEEGKSKSVREKQKVEEEEEEDGDDEIILKRRISSHPLYGLLIDHHLHCLQATGIDGILERNERIDPKQQLYDILTTSSKRKSELDHFMEAYCCALSKLREAMEEPQQETRAFINTMHSQLRDLINPCPSPNQSSGKGND